jgi:hypothetical protein
MLSNLLRNENFIFAIRQEGNCKTPDFRRVLCHVKLCFDYGVAFNLFDDNSLNIRALWVRMLTVLKILFFIFLVFNLFAI